MKIILGKEAEDQWRQLPTPPPSTAFTGPVLVTGSFWVRVSTCTIITPGSLMPSANWDDSVAALRYIFMHPAESVVLIPQGQGVVYSPNPVTEQPSVIPGSVVVPSLPVTIPDELSGGVIMCTWRNFNVLIPMQNAWLFKLGTMNFERSVAPGFAAISPIPSSTILNPSMVYDARGATGPQWRFDVNTQATSGATHHYVRHNAADTPIAIRAGVLIDRRAGSSTLTGWSQPIFIEHTITAAAALKPTSWLIAIAELSSAGLPVVDQASNCTVATGVLYPAIVKCLYTIFTSCYTATNVEQDRWDIISFFPNWYPAVGNCIVSWVAPDILDAGLGTRYASGYAPAAFRVIQSGTAKFLVPIGTAQNKLATNVQPL